MNQHPATVAPAAGWPETVSGYWSPTFRAVRGDDQPWSPFRFWLYIDGEPVGEAYGAQPHNRNYDGVGGQQWQAHLDTRRFANGPHRVRVYGFPVEPEPQNGAPRWHAYDEATVVFENGSAPMALLPGVSQAVVTDATPIRLEPALLRCDGSVTPVEGALLALTSASPRVAFSPNAITVVSEGWATVTAALGDLTATIRVGRYPASTTEVPNLGPFLVAPFYQSFKDEQADPGIAAALKAEGLRTFWTGTVPNIGTRTLAEFQQMFEWYTSGVWDFLREHPEADFVIVCDDIARQRHEARATLANPIWREAYLWAFQQWQERTGGRLREIRVIDEIGYGPTPFVTDGRWNNYTPTLAVTSSRDATHVRFGNRDLSALPIKSALTADDERPILHVRSGPHAGRWCRVERGNRTGEVTLATDARSTAGGFNPTTMRLSRGDQVVISGWAAHPDHPLPDDTWLQFAEMFNASGIPWSVALGNGAPGTAVAAWAKLGNGPRRVCDVYTHTAAGCDFPPLAEGHTLPQGRIGRQQMWWATQDAIDPRTALIGLVTGMGAYYTKGDSDPTRADYDPAIDILHAGTGRGINTGMLLALHLVEGGCGASVYGMDNLEQRRQRMRETNPRTVFGEPLQTGFHPYGTGETGHIFRAVGAFKRCVDALGPARLFAPMGLAPSLGPGLVTSVRRTAQGDLLLIVNTREVEVTTAPLPMAGARMAHYTCGEEYSVTPVPAGEVRLALQPGAMVALVPVTEDGTEEVAG